MKKEQIIVLWIVGLTAIPKNSITLKLYPIPTHEPSHVGQSNYHVYHVLHIINSHFECMSLFCVYGEFPCGQKKLTFKG